MMSYAMMKSRCLELAQQPEPGGFLVGGRDGAAAEARAAECLETVGGSDGAHGSRAERDVARGG